MSVLGIYHIEIKHIKGVTHMSDDAKKVIETIKKGELPPLSSNSTADSKGTQTLQHGINLTEFDLQTRNNTSKDKK